MDVVVTITEYKRQLKSIGYAEATIESYSRNLDLFRRYLQDLNIADLRKVTHQVICDYQQKIMSEPVAMETRALKLRVVKRLFEYLCQTHRLLINPTEGIVETNRQNRKIGTVLTVAEVRRLLKQPNLSLRTGIRDRAIMEVLYCTGMRLDELLNLQVYHVDFKDRVLYIRKGKGNKQRVVPLGKNARKYLKEYLEKIRPWYAKKNPRERKLFLNQSGLAMTKSNLRVNLRKYRDEAGIRKSASPHAFRRSCATHLLQNGADIRYIQKLLGHRHLKTTQAYTKVMPVEVKQTHNRTHPGIRKQKSKGKKSE
ncbi:Site-specific tyrosine recombinase XerD [Olavius algarvensis Delta 1 endosymbiont]|nr:Site-specific tyrosine recombinase XerD [Olavius algarvensis Delta 1 endosymbiont]